MPDLYFPERIPCRKGEKTVRPRDGGVRRRWARVDSTRRRSSMLYRGCSVTLLVRGDIGVGEKKGGGGYPLKDR